MRFFVILLYILVLVTVGLILLDIGVRIAYQIDVLGYNASTNLTAQLNLSIDTSRYNFLMAIVPYLHILDVATAIAVIFSIFALFLYFKER